MQKQYCILGPSVVFEDSIHVAKTSTMRLRRALGGRKEVGSEQDQILEKATKLGSIDYRAKRDNLK